MVGVAKKEDAADDGSSGADPCPDGIGRPDGDVLHGLGNREEAEDDKNDGDDAGDEFTKPLAVFQGDSKTYFEKSRQEKKDPSNRHTQPV